MKRGLFLQLIFTLGSLLVLTSCPNTNSELTAEEMRHGNARVYAGPNGRRVMDEMCETTSRCQDELLNPNRLNRGGVFSSPGPCADGNCPPGHRDRTRSVPPTSDLDVPGFTPWSEALSADIRSYVNRDNAPVGYCGRGVRNILTRLCIRGIPKADGHRWDNNLAANPNFREVSCQPSQCPVGTILTYEHETPRPRNPPAGQKGRRYGHVEFVTSNGRGGKTYCSSHCQSRWGGSVRHTRRRAFVYVGGSQCKH